MECEAGWIKVARLEDHLVSALINKHEINKDQNADVLYDLAGQAMEHLRSRLGDDDKVRDVLRE